MRKRLLLCSLSLAPVFLGCGRDPSLSDRRAFPSFDHAELHPRRLQGRVIVGGLSLPLALAVVDPFLAVADKGSDSLLKVYRTKDGTLIFAAGRVGSGPGEFRGISVLQGALNSTPQHPGVWAYDATLRRLTFVDLSLAGQEVEPSSRPLIALRPEATLTSVAWKDDSTIVGIGFLLKGRVGIFNRTGEQTGTIGPLPSDDRTVPPTVIQHAYQSYLALKPDGSLLVVANRHAGRMELLRPTGERVGVIRGPYYFEPVIKVAPGLDSAKTPVFASGDDLRFGYLAVVVTDTTILGLFSGRVSKAFPREANLGQFVHVFDWSGKFLRAYDLGQPVFTVALDPSGQYLYAARHNPEPGVLVFDLAAPE